MKLLRILLLVTVGAVCYVAGLMQGAKQGRRDMQFEAVNEHHAVFNVENGVTRFEIRQSVSQIPPLRRIESDCDMLISHSILRKG